MCQKMKADIIDHLNRVNKLKMPSWPTTLRMHVVENFYDCVRCTLGRSCPKGIEHTLVPGECRYGKWAPGTKPQKRPLTEKDPLTIWKEQARKEKLDTIELQVRLEHTLDIPSIHYFKTMLMEMVNETLVFFGEAVMRGADYFHWCDNPLHLELAKTLLKDTMIVKGIRTELRPFKKPVAQPELAARSSYLRLPCIGTVKNWTLGPLEDTREMSWSQIHAAIDVDDWMLVFFGVEPGVASPSTPTSHHRRTEQQPGIPPRRDDTLAVPEVHERPEEPQPASLQEPIYEDNPEEEESFEVAERPEIAPLRPNYNLKKVLEKLPKIVEDGDIVKAKTLLCGLHERLWHAPISDFQNLLRRAGLPSEVLRVAAEAVRECPVCRKHVRLPNRPQTRTGGATSFGDALQLDLFQWQGQWYLLLIDEATRFKMCDAAKGLEAEPLMEVLFNSWIYLFGPPSRIIMDQQVALMSHETGAEFERLGITRSPRGTTAGKGSDQHTGTGLAERHVGLMKLTMWKVKAELNRQGIVVEDSEVAKESAMAQNLTINYHGATPAMSVFGTLPRGFYNPDSEGTMSVSGSLQTDLTVFERAMRIRQTALSQVQHAIAEDRVARASRTRPHQLEVTSLVAGTSEVEFYREVEKDPGWRGPALLLRLDSDDGTAVIQYQGRPYLVSLRHIREYKGIYHVNIPTIDVESALLRLMKYVEGLVDYKVYMYGWVFRKNGKWHMVPKESPQTKEILDRARLVSSSITKKDLHGIMVGKSLRSFKPPANTTGTLVTWILGGKEYAVQEHHSANHLKMKRVSNYIQEQLCMIYFFYYNLQAPEEGEGPLAPVIKKMEGGDGDQSAATMDVDPANNKRTGPETRTVVIAPERKKARHTYYEMITKNKNDYMISFHYYQNKKKIIDSGFPEQWLTDYRLANQNTLNAMMQQHDQERRQLPILFNIYYKVSSPALCCLRTANIYKVDTDTDNVEEHDLTPELWNLVEEADESEIKQFVDEKAFKKLHKEEISSEMIVIDARWVRKWKRYPDKSIRMKSRLCARGCLDGQKQELTTRSTTATRLSQRMIVSTSARLDFDLESLDISGAFLKGLSFNEIQKALKKKGIYAPHRAVVIFPPANVWRHLGKFASEFAIKEYQVPDYGLLCNKPVYGLNDAPLAWQLSLGEHLESTGGVASKMDENFHVWKDDRGKIYGVLTSHVDDLAICGSRKFLDEMNDGFIKRFKKVSRQTLPFDHCGAEYSRTPEGFMITQKAFTERMKPAAVPAGKKDDERLTSEEVTDFRSILGALLWLTSTRLDLVAEVSLLQSRVTVAEVRDIKQANNVLDKAVKYKENGLHYRKFKTPHQRIVVVHDASSASKGRTYAQEGVLVFMADDNFKNYQINHEMVCTDETVKMHGGVMHLLMAYGAKAKRVSYSTSHGETLAMVGGIETGTLCMIRMAEIYHEEKRPTIKQMVEIQENGHPELPVDCYGDCRDLYELCTGSRTLPQDKTQRLYVLSIKESRLTGRIRMISLVPTECMTADSLTKAMISPCMMHLLTTGIVEFWNEEKHPVVSRVVPTVAELTEDDLYKDDETFVRDIKNDKRNVMYTHSAVLFGLCGTTSMSMTRVALFLGLASRAMAAAGEVPHQEDNTAMYVMMAITGLAVIGIQQLMNRCAAWTTRRRIEQSIPKTPTEAPTERRSAPPTPMDVDQGRLDYDEYTPGAESGSGIWRDKPASLTMVDVSMKLDDIKRWMQDEVEHYKAENKLLRGDNMKLKNEMSQRLQNQSSLEASLNKAIKNEEKLKDTLLEKEDEIARMQVNIRGLEGQSAHSLTAQQAKIARIAELENQNRELRSHALGQVPVKKVPERIVVSRTGDRYHAEGCRHARGSDGRILTPCRDYL